MAQFIEINPREINDNVFRLIGKEWMLISAGTEQSMNTMTASWGGLGVLWNENVSFAFVRPSRYTFSFLEAQDCYSLSFFDEKDKHALQICGKMSGRDGNKLEAAGLTPIFDAEAPTFSQSRLTLICRKMYTDQLHPECFLDDSIANNYNDADYHHMYVGKIVKVLFRV